MPRVSCIWAGLRVQGLLARRAQRKKRPGSAYIWYPDHPSSRPSLPPPSLFLPFKKLCSFEVYFFIQPLLNDHTQCVRTREDEKEVYNTFPLHSDLAIYFTRGNTHRSNSLRLWLLVTSTFSLLLKWPLPLAWIIAVAVALTNVPLSLFVIKPHLYPINSFLKIPQWLRPHLMKSWSPPWPVRPSIWPGPILCLPLYPASCPLPSFWPDSTIPLLLFKHLKAFALAISCV